MVSSWRGSSSCRDAAGAAPFQQPAWWLGLLLQSRQKGAIVCLYVHNQKSRAGLLSSCRTPEFLRLAQTLFHLLQPCSGRDTQSRVLRAVSRLLLETSKESAQPLPTCTSSPLTANVPHTSSVLHSDRTGLYHIYLCWLCAAQNFFREKAEAQGNYFSILLLILWGGYAVISLLFQLTGCRLLTLLLYRFIWTFSVLFSLRQPTAWKKK